MKLTKRQQEILKLRASGLACKQIAADLGIALSTVKNTLSNLYEKIGAVNSVHAYAICKKDGLI
jgi:DNA-binding CsgD family transcriptional regulator